MSCRGPTFQALNFSMKLSRDRQGAACSDLFFARALRISHGAAAALPLLSNCKVSFCSALVTTRRLSGPTYFCSDYFYFGPRMSSLKVIHNTALKVIDSPAPFRKEVEFGEAGAESAHSLHYALALPDSFAPDLPGFFIERYSRRGDLILDPFCGAGATALEAALRGRVVCYADSSPMAVRITRAKLAPSDLTEVTLKLQTINLKRPINIRLYTQEFSPFYDIDTFRELVNLRSYVAASDDRVTRFVELLALTLLHGHNAGYLSAYSYPHVALTPDDQRQLNMKRGQTPDYRSLVPRILRKAAAVLRDGIPSILRQTEPHHFGAVGDARNLSQVASASVQLTVTAPPLPFIPAAAGGQQWLRNWFLGAASGERAAVLDLAAWIDFMNESLLELARVTRPGGRAAIDLREVRVGAGRTVALDHELAALVGESLSRFWDVEGFIVEKTRRAQIKDCLAERDHEKLSRRSRIVVLRRR